MAIISIDGVGDYKWHLPTHVDINLIEDGIKKNQNGTSESQDDFSAKTSSLPEIEFRESFGMIGFRAHLYQGADIKELTIDALK